MSIKKQLPLPLTKALEDTFEVLSEFGTREQSDDFLHFVDKDENSDFYFTVQKRFEHKSAKLFCGISYKPKSTTELHNVSYNVEIESIVKHAKAWIERVKTFDNTKSFLDDPIIKEYEKEFKQEFIVDEEGETEPFNLKQQLFLDNYLSEAIKKIEAFKVDKSEEESKELEELISKAEEIRLNITKKPKNQVLRSLSTFWAKAQKAGLPVLKEVFIDFTTELTSKLIKGLIE